MPVKIDQQVVRAAQDERERERFIQSQQRFILRVASRTAHRFVTTSDDEWSAALYAFSKAIDTYQTEKGSFFAYAETAMRRSLIDTFRSQNRFSQEIAVSPDAFDGAQEGEEPTGVQYVVIRNSVRAADTSLKEEIEAMAAACQPFGFGFSDLMRASPRQVKTRRACAEAVRFLLSDPERLERLTATRQLPMQTMCQQAGLSEKLLDRYRKYIIAAVVVLSGDYPMLSEYFKFIEKEAAI